MIRYELLVSQT